MQPPSLPDDLIEEVLLRVRADDPASLVRAALACKHWCRIIADPAFRRRRLERHGATPRMLGFLCKCDGTQTYDMAGFVPMSSFCPPRADHRGLQALDARHGRVLLLLQDKLSKNLFVVWNPLTGQRVALPRPPWWSSLGNGSVKAAATVLCAATATGTCDHLDCHRGPFSVVLVGANDVVVNRKMFTCIYSSESGAWSEPTFANHPGDDMDWGRSALVGNTLFFKLRTYHKILKYDVCTQKTFVIDLPRAGTGTMNTDSIQIELTTLEDGRLGFVRREKSNKLCLWSRDGEGDDQVARWTLRRVIHLKKLFPLVDSLHFKHLLVGVVEGVCVAFMAVQNRGLFTIHMQTGLMYKVSEDYGTSRCVVPYIDFCTPALRAPSLARDDEQAEETPPGNPR